MYPEGENIVIGNHDQPQAEPHNPDPTPPEPNDDPYGDKLHCHGCGPDKFYPRLFCKRD